MTGSLLSCYSVVKTIPPLQVESMVRVLQLVSVLVEALGGRIAPHLNLIASALPQVIVYMYISAVVCLF